MSFSCHLFVEFWELCNALGSEVMFGDMFYNNVKHEKLTKLFKNILFIV